MRIVPRIVTRRRGGGERKPRYMERKRAAKRGAGPGGMLQRARALSFCALDPRRALASDVRRDQRVSGASAYVRITP